MQTFLSLQRKTNYTKNSEINLLYSSRWLAKTLLQNYFPLTKPLNNQTLITFHENMSQFSTKI